MNKVKGYRVMLNLTQKEMAEKLGISETNYRDKELGNRDFTQSEIIKFVNVVKEKNPNVTMDDIFLN